MKRIFEALRWQLPVGQGGLHSTLLRAAGREFWFLYDCGSLNKSALSRELEQLDNDFGERPLDLLVLSHLDEDHVNGVERLFSRREVRRVMIPYLDDAEKLVLVAHAAANDAVTESNLRLYADPEGWFERHGVGEIIVVRPARGDDIVPPAPPQGEPPPPDNEVEDEWSAMEEGWRFDLRGPQPIDEERPARSSSAKATKRPARAKSMAARRELPAGRPLTVCAGLSSVWELVPFWLPVADSAAFAKEARRTFKLRGKLTDKNLGPILRSYVRRRELADLYASWFKKRNRTSLCLYSGPSWRVRGGKYIGQRAWLSTGDAPLAESTYQRSFIGFYRSRFSYVDAVVLPHHGARADFPRQGLPDLHPENWLAAAGVKNPYGHPDPGLRAALRRQASFHQVSNRRRTLYADRLVIVR